jgi:dihydroxyacetone kinase-like predicted kinase
VFFATAIQNEEVLHKDNQAHNIATSLRHLKIKLFQENGPDRKDYSRHSSAIADNATKQLTIKDRFLRVTRLLFKNILLTAKQAAELSGRESVSVIPTKSFPEGYAALAVFNSSVEELDEQISDMTDAKNAVSTIEITEAVRDTVIDGISVKEGETLGILDGKIVCSTDTVEDAVIASVQSVCDLDEKELLTVFVGAGVAEEERAAITELIEDRFEDLSVEVFIGNQEVYKYVISIE